MRGKIQQGGLAGVAAAVLALVLWAVGSLDLWEYAAWRWRVAAFAEPGAATASIKLVLLDQASLSWGEKENAWSWPWPREVYGPIIDFCIRAGARVIVLDLLFTEPSLYGTGDDRALAAAIDRAPTFLAPLYLGRKSGSVTSWPPHLSQRLAVTIPGLDAWLTRSSHQEVVMTEAAFPVDEVLQSSAILASVSQEPDFDGIFRRGHLFHVFDERVVPSFALAAFLAGAGAVETNGTSGIPMEVQDESIRIDKRTIPTDASGKAVLRFRGATGIYDTFSAAALIQSELRLREGGKPVIDPGVLKDSYVFIGCSAPGLLDLRPTPVSKVSPGVELHATMLDNLISNDFLQIVPPWLCPLSTLFLAVLAGIVTSIGKKVRHSVLAVAVLLPTPVAIGFLAYPLGYWWPITVHEAATALSLIGAVLLNYAYEGRQKAFIKKAFKQYLSPAVIEKILEDPSKLELGGERRELSILFSDLQGFSSISERLEPQALTSLLNEYLTDMTDIILEEGGTLDKYEGDAIIAFWNAPLDQPDHALHACRAAVRCQRKLAERRSEMEQRTGAVLLMRIGINTGQVVVGNMGSKKRFDYTVLGDAANLASRLEGANKVFGTYTMVSESTWSLAGGDLAGRELGLLRVVGRKTPVRVYELFDQPESKSAEAQREFELGLRSYHAGDWARALESFAGLPDDPVSRVYTSRCEALLRTGDETWDGVWNLTEK